MTQEELNEAFRERAELCREATRHTVKIELLYDQTSLLRIDEIISTAWPQSSSGQDNNKRVEIWASYLGECLRAIFGGEWVKTELAGA